MAVHESFGSFIAQVAEVTVKPDGSLQVDRVVCAVDCGMAINPDNIVAQVQGGLGFGLSAALRGAITMKDGVVEQSNFHDYAPIRIDEMPRLEVHIAPSAEKPTGIGRPGVPPLAPRGGQCHRRGDWQTVAQSAVRHGCVESLMESVDLQVR